MGHRLSKIYTRTGDQGQTGLGDGSRIGKDDLRIQVLGDIDELNATVGVLRSHLQISELAEKQSFDEKLHFIQHWLFDLGGEICIPDYTLLNQQNIDFLEQDIDAMNSQLPMLKDFILPSGTLLCSYSHLARSVCRRAERHLIALHHRDGNIQHHAMAFLNRLSDWFFVISRTFQRLQQQKEVIWQKNYSAKK